jgi:DNA-binding MarR family transcriptional regulator
MSDTYSALQIELKQSRPFASAAEEAQLGVQRTAEVLGRGTAELLRPYGLTPTQYNVLRILRGAGPEGLPCAEIGTRMLTHEPDVTRLLDRLQKAGLIARARAAADRRVVLTRITESGLVLLARLDGPVAELSRRRLGALSDGDLRSLIHLLDAVRAAAVAVCAADIVRAAADLEKPDAATVNG